MDFFVDFFVFRLLNAEWFSLAPMGASYRVARTAGEVVLKNSKVLLLKLVLEIQKFTMNNHRKHNATHKSGNN